MALSTSKLVLNAVSKAVNNGRQFSVFKSTSQYMLRSRQDCQAARTWSRSMWNLCSGSRRNCTGQRGDSTPGALAKGMKKVRLPGTTCSCGCGGAGLHTEADGELVNFLKEEIDVEQGSLTNIPKISGFDITVDGADVKLTKETGGERVTVKFSVNHSVEMEGAAPAEPEPQEQESSPEMRSYPDFTVDVSKGSGNSLRISCAFQRDDDLLDDQEVDAEADDEDLFIIDEVMFAKEGAATSDLEATYRVGTEVMNGELYDRLKSYLADRGVEGEFCEKLSDLASAVEHRQYISFLHELQSFIKQ